MGQLYGIAGCELRVGLAVRWIEGTTMGRVRNKYEPGALRQRGGERDVSVVAIVVEARVDGAATDP